MQGFPHSLEKGIENDKSRISWLKNMLLKKNGWNNKQELKYGPEAGRQKVAQVEDECCLSHARRGHGSEKCIMIGYS